MFVIGQCEAFDCSGHDDDFVRCRNSGVLVEEMCVSFLGEKKRSRILCPGHWTWMLSVIDDESDRCNNG